MSYANFDNLAAATAKVLPFPHVLCADFIPAAKLTAIHRDFPQPSGAGSFPLLSLNYGDAFSALIKDLRSPQMAGILAEKLDAPLVNQPTMVTVRGFCRETDGKIHLDSSGKLVTVLLYLNRGWDEQSGGRLRLLNNGEDINDYFLEIPPGNGVLLAFRCDNNAWHGHLPFAGERRAIQLNWAASRAYYHREATRHFISAAIKKTRAAFAGRPA